MLVLFYILALFTVGVTQEIPPQDRLPEHPNHVSFTVRWGLSERGIHVFHDSGEVIKTRPRKVQLERK